MPLRGTQKNCLPCSLWDPSCSPRQPQCGNTPYFFEKDRPSLDLALHIVKNTAAASKALLVPKDPLSLLHKAALHLHHLFSLNLFVLKPPHPKLLTSQLALGGVAHLGHGAVAFRSCCFASANCSLALQTRSHHESNRLSPPLPLHQNEHCQRAEQTHLTVQTTDFREHPLVRRLLASFKTPECFGTTFLHLCSLIQKQKRHPQKSHISGGSWCTS